MKLKYLTIFFLISLIILAPNFTQAAWYSIFDKVGWGVISGITSIVELIVGFIIGWILILSTLFLEWAVDPGITNITGQTFVVSGVLITRSIANLVLIAILLTISIATIIGIENYGIRKALPMLIGVALLINFSSVITGIVIDMGQVPLEFFTNKAFPPDFSIGKAFQQSLHLSSISVNSFNLSGSNYAYTTQHALSNLGVVLITGAIGVMASFMFFKLGILLLLRYVAFWILTILAPFVFAISIFPSTRKYLTKWFMHLFEWSFLGVIAVFFIYLALLVLISFDISSEAVFTKKLQGENNSFGNFGITIISLFTVYFFLQYGYSISKKMAGEGAMAIVNGIGNLIKGGAIMAATGGLGASALLGKGMLKRGIGVITGKRKDEHGNEIEETYAERGKATMEKYGSKLRTGAWRFMGGKQVGNWMMDKEKLSDTDQKSVYELSQAMKMQIKNMDVNKRGYFFKKQKTKISRLAAITAMQSDATGMDADTAIEASKYIHLMDEGAKKQFKERYGYISAAINKTTGVMDEKKLAAYMKIEGVSTDKFDIVALKNKLNSIDSSEKMYEQAIRAIRKQTNQKSMRNASIFNQELAKELAAEPNKTARLVENSIQLSFSKNLVEKYAERNKIFKADGKTLDIEEAKKEIFIYGKFAGMGSKDRYEGKDIREMNESKWKNI